MKTRIIKKANEFYPQYLSKTFWGADYWRHYKEYGSPCYLSGASGGYLDASFSKLESAKEFIKNQNPVTSVVWKSDDKVQKRPINVLYGSLCDICFVDKDADYFHVGDDLYRECVKCGHKIHL